MSIRTFCCMAAALILSLGTTTAQADSLLERYPHEESVTLSNGQQVWLPLHIQEGTGVVLVGLANLDRLTEYLAPQGLKPLPLTPTQGFVALYNMNYARSDIGAYKELVIVVAATRDHRPRVPVLSTVNDYAGLLAVYVPLLRGLIGDRSEDVLFTWKFYVTDELSMLAGREVWGFPKTLADIDVSVSSQAVKFSVEEGGELVLRGSYCRLLPWHMPVSVDAYLATPVDIKPTIVQGIAETQSRFDFFMPWDQFEVNANHPCGAALKSIEFKPMLWHTMSALESVFLPPIIE
jgi:Acetoacetate decarboxylase (ADC)